ncbi:MAG TPA: hypothetical protein DEQ02_10760 [Ruminococcaceae bacterium]|nr:hypothetical protein [Oscillospiraceae bacterium]
MKTILILLGSEFSANGICVSRIVDALLKSGYHVICLVKDGEDPRVINGAEILRVKPPLGAKAAAWREKHKGKAAWLLFKLFLAIKKLKLLLLRPVWPIISPLYVRRYKKAAEKLVLTHNIDCVFSVFTPFEALLAGHRIKKKHPEVRFIAYFLDSLSGGVVPRFFSEKSTLKRGLKWERKLLVNADRIVYMKSAQKHHGTHSASNAYYSKMTVLDIPMFTQPESRDTSKPEIDPVLDKTKLNLVYAGSIAPHVRDPAYFFEVFSLLSSSNIALTIIVPHAYRLPAKYSRDPRIRVLNSLAHDLVIETLAQADILVNLGNKLPSMVPSKIFEYMAAGKPIVSTCPIANEPCIDYLSRYPLCLLLPEHNPDPARDARALEKFIDDTKGRSVDPAVMRNKLYQNTPEALAELIGNVLKGENSCGKS